MVKNMNSGCVGVVDVFPAVRPVTGYTTVGTLPQTTHFFITFDGPRNNIETIK